MDELASLPLWNKFFLFCQMWFVSISSLIWAKGTEWHTAWFVWFPDPLSANKRGRGPSLFPPSTRRSGSVQDAQLTCLTSRHLQRLSVAEFLVHYATKKPGRSSLVYTSRLFPGLSDPGLVPRPHPREEGLRGDTWLILWTLCKFIINLPYVWLW